MLNFTPLSVPTTVPAIAQPSVMPTTAFDALFTSAADVPLPQGKLAMPQPPIEAALDQPDSVPTFAKGAAHIPAFKEAPDLQSPAVQAFAVKPLDEQAPAETDKAITESGSQVANLVQIFATSANCVPVSAPTPVPVQASTTAPAVASQTCPVPVDASSLTQTSVPVEASVPVPINLQTRHQPERFGERSTLAGRSEAAALAAPIGSTLPKRHGQSDKMSSEPIILPGQQPSTRIFDTTSPQLLSSAEPVSFSPPVASAQPTVAPQMVQHLDLARDLAWIGNLAQEIVAASNDRETLSFRLMPRSIGQLDVDLSRSPDGLHVEMTATTERAQQIIAAEQPRLLEELRQSGVKTIGTELASGEQSGSQRGQQQPRNDLQSAAFKARLQPDKPETRPDGRFA